MSFAPASHNFEKRAKDGQLSSPQILNSNNNAAEQPAESDVVVVGGGIHSLIYAIHAKKQHPNTSISVYEKSSSPGYKIGESALTPLGLWMVKAGIPTAIILRLFGVKDGLAFYYFNEKGDPEDYGEFCANGPPADWVPTFQMERSVSELLLTLLAQRNGINVYHGHAVDIDGTSVSYANNVVKVKDVGAQQVQEVNTKLVVDATGRFRRFASKEARLERFEGWNTDAFWAYFTMNGDESDINLRVYESCNTNHICVPEGWAWVIRLPSWEGSPIPNLMDMINYLLDLAAKDAAGDEYPSALKLAEMFNLKFQWVVSIGFALRTDTKYPKDLTPWGTREAEQKFNWIVSKYPKVTDFMSKHTLIENLYGPNTTWFIRKQLAYKSPKVFGDGWVAIGDAAAFTNPLFSPGINANMAVSVLAAEKTGDILKSKSSEEYHQVMEPFAKYVSRHADNLNRFNKFHYVCFRHPKLGPISDVWTYIAGQGNKVWQNRKAYDFHNIHEIVVDWNWGAGEPVFIEVADKIIDLLEGPPEEQVPEEIVKEVIRVSDEYRRKTLALEGSPYKNRWDGLLRFYDKDLERVDSKDYKDIYARRCKSCTNWTLIREDWLSCVTCGHQMTKDEATIRPVGPDGLLNDPYGPAPKAVATTA